MIKPGNNIAVALGLMFLVFSPAGAPAQAPRSGEQTPEATQPESALRSRLVDAIARDQELLEQLRREEKEIAARKERAQALTEEQQTISRELEDIDRQIEQLSQVDPTTLSEDMKAHQDKLKANLEQIRERLMTTREAIGKRSANAFAVYGDQELARIREAQRRVKQLLDDEKNALKEVGGKEGGKRKLVEPKSKP